MKLWEIAKAGRDYRPRVDRIRQDKSFEECGFKGEEPEMKVIDGVKIWYEGEITAGRNYNGIIEVTSEGSMYVGLPSDYKDGSMVFQSIEGKVIVKR